MYLCLVINVPDRSIQEINEQTQLPTKANESIQGCINVLLALQAGAVRGSVQNTTRDSDPSIGTSGSGSEQNTYSKL